MCQNLFKIDSKIKCKTETIKFLEEHTRRKENT